VVVVEDTTYLGDLRDGENGEESMQRRCSAVGGRFCDWICRPQLKETRKKSMQVKGGFQRQVRHSVACTDFWEVKSSFPTPYHQWEMGGGVR
jgi:hypothetical protein